jgi:hypothetical protein
MTTKEGIVRAASGMTWCGWAGRRLAIGIRLISPSALIFI